MLVISRTQMHAMDDLAVRRFVEDLVDELPRTQPAFVMGLSRAELTERCRNFVSIGRSVGLSARTDLHGFVVLSFLLGAGFHEHPAIDEVLRGNEVEHGRKMLVVTTAILNARKRAEQRRAEVE